MNVTAGTQTRSNAGRIWLIISNVCSCELLIKPALLFFCGYEMIERSGIRRRWPSKRILRINAGGGGDPLICRLYIKNACFNYQLNALFLYSIVQSDSTYRHLSFLLQKKKKR
jgi:hypothetical protein